LFGVCRAARYGSEQAFVSYQFIAQTGAFALQELQKLDVWMRKTGLGFGAGADGVKALLQSFQVPGHNGWSRMQLCGHRAPPFE
jgi:hypothetical protein